MSEFKSEPVIKIQQIQKPYEHFYEAICDDYPDLKADSRYVLEAYERIISSIDKRRNRPIMQGKLTNF